MKNYIREKMTSSLPPAIFLLPTKKRGEYYIVTRCAINYAFLIYVNSHDKYRIINPSRRFSFIFQLRFAQSGLADPRNDENGGSFYETF